MRSFCREHGGLAGTKAGKEGGTWIRMEKVGESSGLAASTLEMEESA